MTATQDAEKKGVNLWGGRFLREPSALMRALNDSFHVDHRLVSYDIAGSTAWVQALERSSVLTSEEASALRSGLAQIRSEVESGKPLPIADYEDVHSWLEARLGEIAGPVAGKLHTGRSRNDQVATDLRLWLRDAFEEGTRLALDLAKELATRALAEHATPMPGYTHLKRAEPITFGHWCLAYAEMLLRDADRFADASERADECPLGSGALSGTPLPIDRRALARSLGFARETANSLDAVSDRDAAVEYVFAATLLFGHLSRMAEDLIFHSSDEVAFVELPDELATGSSRMPHKKNPDALELARGHAGRAIGDLTGLLAVMKGIPLAYDKDLQLDKEPLFRMQDTMRILLPVLSSMIAGIALDRDRMRAAASSDLLLATELADALAARGVPFRQAHEIVGKRIAMARIRGCRLSELDADDGIDSEDLAALDVDRALARRNAFGGTAPERVREAAAKALLRIERTRTRNESDESDRSDKSDFEEA